MKLPTPTVTVATSTRASEDRLSRRPAASPGAGVPSNSQTAASASKRPATLYGVSGSPRNRTASAAVRTKLRRKTGALMLIDPVLRLCAKL